MLVWATVCANRSVPATVISSASVSSSPSNSTNRLASIRLSCPASRAVMAFWESMATRAAATGSLVVDRPLAG